MRPHRAIRARAGPNPPCSRSSHALATFFLRRGPSLSAKTINRLRRQIDQIDDDLLRLLARRADARSGDRPRQGGGRPQCLRPCPREEDSRPLEPQTRRPPRARRARHLPRDHLRVAARSSAASRRVSRPRGDVLAHGGARAVRGRRHVRAGGVDRRGLRRGRARRADFGVVPVENSTEGVVAHTLDRFARVAAPHRGRGLLASTTACCEASGSRSASGASSRTRRRWRSAAAGSPATTRAPRSTRPRARRARRARRRGTATPRRSPARAPPTSTASRSSPQTSRTSRTTSRASSSSARTIGGADRRRQDVDPLHGARRGRRSSPHARALRRDRINLTRSSRGRSGAGRGSTSSSSTSSVTARSGAWPRALARLERSQPDAEGARLVPGGDR